MKAMLFSAGLGTRLKPFTDTHPKALAIVNGKTLLESNIEYLKSFGIEEFVINVHHFADQIEDFLKLNNNFNVSIYISDEREALLETGGGLLKAKPFLVDDDFLVMNVDILTDLNVAHFIDFHRKNCPLVSLAVSERNSSRKLLFQEDMQLKGWKNLSTGEIILASDKDLQELAFSGIHIISPHFFELVKKEGKFSIMTTYMDLMRENTILGYDHSGGKLIDVGILDNIAKAERLFS